MHCMSFCVLLVKSLKYLSIHLGSSRIEDWNICTSLPKSAADWRNWANQTQTNNGTGMRGRTGPLRLPASLSLTTKTSLATHAKHKCLYALNRDYTHTHKHAELTQSLVKGTGLRWEQKGDRDLGNAITWTGSPLQQLHFLPISCQTSTCFLSLPTSIFHSLCPSLIAFLPFCLTQLLM